MMHYEKISLHGKHKSNETEQAEKNKTYCFVGEHPSKGYICLRKRSVQRQWYQRSKTTKTSLSLFVFYAVMDISVWPVKLNKKRPTEIAKENVLQHYSQELSLPQFQRSAKSVFFVIHALQFDMHFIRKNSAVGYDVF